LERGGKIEGTLQRREEEKPPREGREEQIQAGKEKMWKRTPREEEKLKRTVSGKGEKLPAKGEKRQKVEELLNKLRKGRRKRGGMESLGDILGLGPPD